MGIVSVQDCLEGMKALAHDSIDIVVTSPPYNIDVKYGQYADNQNREQYLTWLNEVFEQVTRVLKPTGHFWLNMGFTGKDPWVGMDVANIARKHLTLQNNFTWVKSLAVNGEQLGHYKPINSDRFANMTWEHLFHFTQTGSEHCFKTAVGVPYAYKQNVNKDSRKRGKLVQKLGFKNQRDFAQRATPSEHQKLNQLLQVRLERARPLNDAHCQGTTWFVPYETINVRSAERGSHPATFPIALVQRAIRFSGAKGVLLDPFMGTGSSALGAQREGLDWIGFDIDAHYVEFANKQLTEGVQAANLKARKEDKSSE